MNPLNIILTILLFLSGVLTVILVLMHSGKGTGVFVNADRNVSLFKYDQDGQRHDESVEPQKLSDAVEAARAEYREQHQSHDRSMEQETGLDELCEQKTAEASERDGGSQDRSTQNVQR